MKLLLGVVLALGVASAAQAALPYLVASRFPSDAPAKVYYAFLPPAGVGPGARDFVTVLGYVPDCNGAHACAYATITVMPRQPLGPGRLVRLAEGTHAVYVAPKCGSTPYCRDGSLRFDRGYATVEIDKSMGTIAQLRVLAASLRSATR
jgi:hypothetical protein